MFLAVWLRTHEAGMSVLAMGFALAAAWYFKSDGLVYTGPDIDTPELRLWSIVIGGSVLLIAFGVTLYLGRPKSWLRALVYGCMVPSLVTLSLLASGRTVSHGSFHIVGLLPYFGPALLAFRRAHQAPGEGHALLGLALLVLPVLPFALTAGGVDPLDLKYYAGLAAGLFGTAVLVVSLLRRQRALGIEIERRAAADAMLRDANAALEHRVRERTAHLHELIGGLEAFNRGVSHDLRGPLGGMSQLARMAADAMERGDDSLARRSLPMIASQCDASVRMVNAMLALARLGDATVQRSRVCLAELARSAYEETMLSAPGTRVPELHCGPMPAIRADANLLRVIFVNLMGNAAKFSRESAAPRIEIESRVEGRDVTVVVRDNGIGFDAEVAARLFDPFFRGHDARFEGHGLGLSVVRRAVEAMGGQVRARRAATGGAEIAFTLPGAFVEHESLAEA